MKSVLMLLGSVVLIAATGSIVSPGGSAIVDQPSPLNPTQMELSHDSGPGGMGWVFLNGSGVYVAEQYDVPAGGPWFLNGIKYYVWSNWPDSVYQGFTVACWKMQGGTPGSIVWPTDGNPIYNPNTGGGWIIQLVQPEFNLTQECPSGFLVGVGILYSYPACDGLGFDGGGVGPYDWFYSSGAWGAAPYGTACIRALLDDEYPEAVEPLSLGSVRALYR